MLRYLRGGGKHMKAFWWVLIIITVVTFLGGFVFIFGSGLGTSGARATGAVAQVNGQNISRTEYQTALNNQRQNFVARYGDEPGDREMQTLEAQAFRSLVLTKLLDRKAKDLGLKGTDRDVMLQLQSSPPQVLMSAPAFQTNGQFDPQKYAAAMRDPNNNWAPFEQDVRQALPVRKLQEHLFASIKLTDAELRQEWKNRNERLTLALVSIAPDRSTAPKVSDADLQKVYDKYKSRFTSGPQRRLELLMVPKTFGDGPVKTASGLATSLVQRIRAGEDFATLSRQYSESPGAERGGVIDRVLAPSDFGAQIGPQIALLDTGRVTDPVRDGGRFLFFKVLEKVPSGPNGQPGVRVAQFMVRIKPDEEALRKQAEDLDKVRKRAVREGLGHAATAVALTTTKTPFFDLSSTPTELNVAPAAADWAMGAKLNEVSPVIEALDYFVIAQVAATKEAGPMPRDAIADQLRQLAELEVSIDQIKTKADQLEASLKSGMPLEQAAALMGLTVDRVENITRQGQDIRLFGQNELVGRLFAAKPGDVVGPSRGFSGYVVARLESRTDPDWTAFEASKGQFAQQLLETRQRTFMDRYTNQLLAQAKIKDLRAAGSD